MGIFKNDDEFLESTYFMVPALSKHVFVNPYIFSFMFPLETKH